MSSRAKVAHCCQCGHEIRMTREHWDALHRSGAWFYCPFCGTKQRWTPGPTTEDVLRLENETLRKDRDWWKGRAQDERQSGERMARRIRSLQGVITRQRRQLGAARARGKG